MANTLKNPNTPLISNPVGLDKAIQEIQVVVATLPWLEKSFGRARIQPRKGIDGKIVREPMVYQGSKEYYPVLPNDALKSYSFFKAKGVREFEDVGDYNFTIYEKTIVELTFWVNLEAIDNTKNYYFTDDLIEEVKALLMVQPGAIIVSVVDEDAREIFKGYTLKEEQRDLLMYPYGAFKIELELRYEMSCQN